MSQYKPGRDENDVERPVRDFSPLGGRAMLDPHDDQAGDAYDRRGRWLGMSNRDAIENAAANGFIIDPGVSEASELSAWTLWNDAVASGVPAMLAEDGAQIIGAGDDVYLRVRRDPDGWSTDWLDGPELESQYFDHNLGCYRLVFADKPFILQ